MNMYVCYGLIDRPFHGFLNFGHGQVWENLSTPLKKIAKFESDMVIRLAILLIILS